MHPDHQPATSGIGTQLPLGTLRLCPTDTRETVDSQCCNQGAYRIKAENVLERDLADIEAKDAGKPVEHFRVALDREPPFPHGVPLSFHWIPNGVWLMKDAAWAERDADGP
jgi:hypothetical protein